MPDYDGHFMAPGMEEEPLPVKPFIKEIEQRHVQEFEDKFSVSLETDGGRESYKAMKPANSSMPDAGRPGHVHA